LVGSPDENLCIVYLRVGYSIVCQNTVCASVKVPSHIQRGADVAVEIARKHLSVAYKDTDGKLVNVVNGELMWDVHKEESMWSLVPAEHIHVSLICASPHRHC